MAKTTVKKVVKKTARSIPRATANRMTKAPKKKSAAPKATGKYVYFFGAGKADGDRTMRDLLGGKGANLHEMTKAGLPVPPGFTITTAACNLWFENGKKLTPAIEAEMEAAVRRLEKLAGAQFGSTTQPAARVGPLGREVLDARHDGHDPQPGAERSGRRGLKAKTKNGRFAYDSYRRFIQMFGAVVLEIPKDKFEHEFEAVKHAHGAKTDTDLDEGGLKETVERYKALIKKEAGKPFPQDPFVQLRGARDAVFRSWQNPRAMSYRRIYEIPDNIGTAVNVQQMVFGNTGDRSATGVGFTRNPGDRRQRVLRRVPRQRTGRRRRRGHPHAAADRRAREGDAEGLQGAAPDHVASREDLPRHPGLRVHDRGRQALHAADPERQAHRVRLGRHRHRLREGEAAVAEGRAAAGRARPRSRSSSRRSSIRPSGRSCRLRRRGCRRRRVRRPVRSCSPPITRSSGRSRARRCCWCARRPCPTTSTAWKSPRASSPRPAA